MQFLNAALLGGLVLATVPLIIHLLNRRRFRVVDWAPMKYLRMTLKTNRRRLRLEQWLLLLLRTLVIVVLILAIARPTVELNSGLVWVSGPSRTSRVWILDDSLSTDYRHGGVSAWERIRRVAVRLSEHVHPKDSLTVLVTSHPESPVLRDIQVTDELSIGELLSSLLRSDTVSDWIRSLEAAEASWRRAPYPVREVTIVTDLRKEGWSPEVGVIARRWATESVTVTLVDAGSRDSANVALVALEQEDPVALPGIPCRFLARLRNDAAEPFGPLSATLSVERRDGDTSARTVLLPRIDPGRTAEIPFSATFEHAGTHAMTLTVPEDALPADNVRRWAVTVRPHLDLVLVDGEPREEPFESECDFLALAFSVGGVPWRVFRLVDSEWLSTPPARCDVLVLANVASLSSEHVASVEQLVRRGMGLMIFPGEQVDLGRYGESLYRGGEGLLPARLDDFVDEPARGWLLEPSEASPLRALHSLAPGTLSRISARRMATVQLPVDAPSTRVIARWNDAAAHPVAVEKQWGRGRVVLWTVTADKAWSDWPIDPLFVLTQREAALELARGGSPDLQSVAGEPIVFELEARAIEAHARTPGEDTDRPLSTFGAESPPMPPVIRHERTQRAGFHRLRWTDERGHSASSIHAVNPGAAESLLAPVDLEELGEWWQPLRPIVVSHSRVEEAVEGPGRELWRTLVWSLLLLLAAESMLAVWVGRRG